MEREVQRRVAAALAASGENARSTRTEGGRKRGRPPRQEQENVGMHTPIEVVQEKS